MKRLDLTRQRFGRLRVIAFAKVSDQRTYWLCRCDCGDEATVSGNALTSGHTRSCGCLVATNHLTHGHARHASVSSEYLSWSAMIQRCTNPKNPNFPRWGGRGIKVCDRWRSFENFLADMGPRPIEKTIERRENDGNYEPSNCCWATRSEQNNNQRSRRRKKAA